MGECQIAQLVDKGIIVFLGSLGKHPEGVQAVDKVQRFVFSESYIMHMWKIVDKYNN